MRGAIVIDRKRCVLGAIGAPPDIPNLSLEPTISRVSPNMVDCKDISLEKPLAEHEAFSWLNAVRIEVDSETSSSSICTSIAFLITSQVAGAPIRKDGLSSRRSPLQLCMYVSKSVFGLP